MRDACDVIDRMYRFITPPAMVRTGHHHAVVTREQAGESAFNGIEPGRFHA